MKTENLLKECDKVRRRVSGYTRKQKADLLEKARKTMSKPLTFKELEIGEKFISFPSDGDDSGHGGYRGTSWVFVKFCDANGECKDTAIRLHDGGMSSMPDGAWVLRVS